MIKKYAILSLLVFVLIQAISLSNLDYLAHSFFKQNALSENNSEQIVTLTLTSKIYYSNIINDDEIKIGNELYDIIKKTFIGKNVVLKLYKDSDEKEFSNKIKNLKKKDKSSKQENSIKGKILFCYRNEPVLDSFIYYYNSNFTIAYSSKTIDDISIGITIPPPKLV